MNHRLAIGVAGALVVTAAFALAAATPSRAQTSGKIHRVGYLSAASIAANPQIFEAFHQALRELGWVEGRNIVLEQRSAEGRFERLPGLAADLVRLKMDVIVAAPTPAALAARDATRTIPIVGVSLNDPVGLRIVPSLARPGGNLTGVTYSVGAEIFRKDLDLLRQAVPKVQKIAVLANPSSPAHALTVENIKAAAETLRLQLVLVDARTAGDFDAAFATIAKERAGALFVVTDPAYIPHRARLIELTAKSRLPSMFTQRADVEAGGLMSHGPSFPEMYRRGAAYVDKILKGARPADLPIEQPTKFEFVVNLKTAKQLGLDLPPALLATAEQIE